LKKKVVSIYSGCGGFDIGFKEAGFKIVFSTDNWEIATNTLNKNKQSGQDIVCEDIGKINFNELRRKHKTIDVLVGGPPCPPFSKSRFYRENLPRAMDDNSAQYTVTEYFRAAKELQPEVLVFENVAGFIFKPHKQARDYLLNKIQELKYSLVFEKVINCADYGVPQKRERYIAIAKKKKNKNSYSFPAQTHIDPKKHNLSEYQNDFFNENLKLWVTCGEVMSDFDYAHQDDQEAGSKHKHLLKQIPPGENYLFFTKERGHKNPKFVWRSRYWSFLLKLSPNLPSWTIQASFSNNQGPFHWTNRFLRIEEIKRIQTFPDDYEIEGSFKEQWRQIGNAVPPLISKIIAKSIKDQLLLKK